MRRRDRRCLLHSITIWIQVSISLFPSTVLIHSFIHRWTSRCVCDRPLCNGDSALVEVSIDNLIYRIPSLPGRTREFIIHSSFRFILPNCSTRCSIDIRGSFMHYSSHINHMCTILLTSSLLSQSLLPLQ